MPVMDGLSAAREIRALEQNATAKRSPRLRARSGSKEVPDAALDAKHLAPPRGHSGLGNHHRVPIVALSAQVMDQDRDAAMSAGMDGFLEKPVRFENMRKLLMPIYAQYPKWENPVA